ncbi:MAG: hypothetical protein ACR2O6_12740 [Ilumatobacteraceae bacterium]
MIRRLLGLVACAVALAACQVDVTVDVVVEPDGTGTITVVTTADAELVRQVPSLADDVVLDDVRDAGWIVTGPTPTADGGLTVTVTHDFDSADEATNLLRSLGPPFNQMALQRGTSGDETTNQLTGLLGLPGGFADYADADLVAAAGALPFEDELAASGATPQDSMSVTITAVLPGVLVEEETNGTAGDAGALVWVVPLDGSVAELRAVSEQAPSEGGVWARPVSVAALVALIAWVVFMTAFIVFVFLARSRRAYKYKRRNRPSRRERNAEPQPPARV